ncbi:MAG: fumarate hydratase [Holophagales bacterium]|jgi:fumarate hydratase subunit alpha|nr:fumarate hydratase [Holophagales bacterium]
MREITAETIEKQVIPLCLTAAYDLPEDVRQAIARAADSESSPLGRSMLNQLIENYSIASKDRVPICQDTGVAVFFVDIGQEVSIVGGTLQEALTKATAAAWSSGYLRMSIAEDPMFTRKNTGINGPPIIHINLVSGSKLKITIAPKGGGSENMSRMAMLKPTAGAAAVADFILETVAMAGGNPCPPIIVGVGAGGNFETAPLLAKKALLRPLGKPNPDAKYADFEKMMLECINDSGIGPQGLGGRTTALAVHIEHCPCHIASLPVAVNLNCHAARHASLEI